MEKAAKAQDLGYHVRRWSAPALVNTAQKPRHYDSNPAHTTLYERQVARRPTQANPTMFALAVLAARGNSEITAPKHVTSGMF